jgi:hypothetical protein
MATPARIQRLLIVLRLFLASRGQPVRSEASFWRAETGARRLVGIYRCLDIGDATTTTAETPTTGLVLTFEPLLGEKVLWLIVFSVGLFVPLALMAG